MSLIIESKVNGRSEVNRVPEVWRQVLQQVPKMSV